MKPVLHPPARHFRANPAAAVARRTLAAAAALAAVVTLAACAPPAPPGFAHLRACSSREAPPDALCGTLSVYENRQTRTGRRIPLAVVVLPALSDEYRSDPVFFLAGGPGQGAATMAPLIRQVFERVRRHRDIVLVDQRGTGRSHPLNCDANEESLQSAFADDAAVAERVRRCLARFDADVRQYTTPVAMDDLDEVREWLGYPRINLYGASYGTRAALVYLRQHGDRVRSLVLDGVAPTNMQLPLFAARDAGRALDALLTDCQNDEACQHRHPMLRTQVRELLARLERAPVRTTLTHPRTGMRETVTVTASVAAGILFRALYAPVTGAMLPLLVEQASQDDFQPLVALAFAGDEENMSVGMQLAVLCSEDAGRITGEQAAEATRGMLFSRHLLAGQLTACAEWPKGSIPDDYFAPTSSDVPALVLSGEIDPVTPPSWGESVAGSLTRSRHLTARATGHGVAMTACGIRLVDDFFERASADALDTTCLDNATRPPFFLTPSGPDPAAREKRVR